MVIRTAFLILFQLALMIPVISAESGRDPTRWQHDIDRFVAADDQNPIKPGGVLFVGSSSIRMWDLDKSFPGLNAVNRGFGGSEIADTTHYFTELIAKHKPRIVVFYAGDNDVAAGNSAKEVHADFREFAKKFQEELPDAQLLYIAIKPSIARWSMADTMKQANALIAADCATDDQFTFIDVWPVMLGKDGQPRSDIFLDDGLHMNEQGYALWAELLRPHLNQ